MVERVKLKACPWCGDTDWLQIVGAKEQAVWCGACDARGPRDPGAPGHEDAIRLWKTRAREAELLAGLKEAREAFALIAPQDIDTDVKEAAAAMLTRIDALIDKGK